MGDLSENSACILPISRVKTIMKSSPDVSNISQESLFIITKATEIFVKDLTKLSLKNSEKENTLDYKDLAEIVNTDESLQFLQDIIPRKIKAREYLESLQKSGDGEER